MLTACVPPSTTHPSPPPPPQHLSHPSSVSTPLPFPCPQHAPSRHKVSTTILQLPDPARMRMRPVLPHCTLQPQLDCNSNATQMKAKFSHNPNTCVSWPCAGLVHDQPRRQQLLPPLQFAHHSCLWGPRTRCLQAAATLLSCLLAGGFRCSSWWRRRAQERRPTRPVSDQIHRDSTPVSAQLFGTA